MQTLVFFFLYLKFMLLKHHGFSLNSTCCSGSVLVAIVSFADISFFFSLCSLDCFFFFYLESRLKES